MRTVFCLLLLASSAVAEPLTISYRRQTSGVGNTMATSLEFLMIAAEITGPIMGGPQDEPFRFIGEWQTTLRQSEVGSIYKLTAADPAFPAFAEAAPGLVPRSHLLLMYRVDSPTSVTPTGELWQLPVSPTAPLGSPPLAFVLDRVEVQLTQFYTSPIGSIVEWDVRLIGNVPEPATAGLAFVLCVGLATICGRWR